MEALLRLFVPAGQLLTSSDNYFLDAQSFIARVSQPAHELLPTVPIRLILHALRIAVAWRQVLQAKGSERHMGGLKGLVGFLVLGLGGSTTAQLLVSSPPSWLANTSVLPLFAAMYYLSSPFLSLLLPWVPTFPLDLAFAVLDAINRTTSAMSVVALLSSHPELGLQQSWVANLLLGGIACSGGGIIAGTLGLWDNDWTLQTPPILKSGDGSFYLIKTLDFWSGALIAAIYGISLDLPAFQPARQVVLNIFGRPSSPASLLAQSLGIKTGYVPTIADTQTTCTLVLASLLLGRVLFLWASAWSRAVWAESTTDGKTSRSEKLSASIIAAQPPKLSNGVGFKKAASPGVKKRKGKKGGEQ